ncbi:hypothetical protein H6G89_23235 [Oscillatoria sp. FACHB-1407]|uniref:trypco2 family protein n=1 Tax=Oscillatoria sp. FACHB-1407 TaxID=2692847 RepID=UPI0016829215|nr:trypco2 family protein [Oscillatoria sp. FACHB-1407]MBD2463920.1 hypothetical protein [Oscillatoria sp. FACHB-1407]
MEDNAISLSEFIEHVKQELLKSVPGEAGEVSPLLVDSVELELKVAVKRDDKGNIRTDVVTTNVKGEEQNNVQVLRVKLSPLGQVPSSVKQSIEAIFKGNDEGSESVGEIPPWE